MLGTVVRYGLPLSFVYCTIYQQNIWREGDERLIVEQKRVWKDFFTLIDNSYNSIVSRLAGSNETTNQTTLRITSMVESMDMRSCWNEKVLCGFSSVDKFVSNPSAILSKIMSK